MASAGLKPSTAMTPPVQRGTSTNPRRPPAHRSVSLKRSPLHVEMKLKQQSDSPTSSDSAVANRPKVSRTTSPDVSPSSLQAIGGRNSSGESSNVDRWFDQSNNEVQESNAVFTDNEPPFFMRNSSSSVTPPELQQRRQEQSTNSLPLRAGLLQLGTDGSSTDDFRGVIDDLTVENKKLKRRLKKYEKFHDSHLKDEKLFEVRFHGLPPEKKRELEDTLRKFAASLHTGGQNAFPPNGYASLVPMLNNNNSNNNGNGNNTNKPASSHTSIQNADSAYASMSASGQGSSMQSGHDNKSKSTPNNLASRQQNVHSYLHHIPKYLLPESNPANMSDRAKKRLVVKRLEQIFAGKRVAGVGNQHSFQQQEVSQMAARADWSALESSGQGVGLEGTREALIMEGKANEDLSESKPENPESGDSAPSEQLPQPAVEQKDVPESFQTKLEQRPTRPLDLDPQRAQVPSDNIRYMRHLGFSPLHADSAKASQDDYGWIYLNFLINMAQLHTLNVTPDFVRKAINEHSEKLEVSDDGRKVRWRGVRGVTRTLSSSDSQDERLGDDSPYGRNPSKRPKLSRHEVDGIRSSLASDRQQAGGASQRARSEHNKYVYTPRFFHRDSTDEGNESSSEAEDESDSSPALVTLPADSSGIASSAVRTGSGLAATTKKKTTKHDNGPIIFYNNTNFCIDLSGDRQPTENRHAPTYTTATAHPVGQPNVVSHGIFERRGPLAEATSMPEPMNLDDNPIPDAMELSFPAQSPSKSDQPKRQDEIELEVTGIGGVYPADNFAVTVKSRQTRPTSQRPAEGIAHAAPKSRPPKVAKALDGHHHKSADRGALRTEIVASKTHDLPPSELPPAIGFLPTDEEFMDEDDYDEEDNMSESPDSPTAFPPSTAPQPLDFAYHSSEEDDSDGDEEDEDEDEEEDDDMDDASDGSVDFLAAARQVDPESIRQKEREYDANMAERLAEEIPAGSSAATAGGGSGFASPASDVNAKEYRRAKEAARPRPKPVDRGRSSDSMAVQAAKGSSSSSDEDDEGDEEMSSARS